MSKVRMGNLAPNILFAWGLATMASQVAFAQSVAHVTPLPAVDSAMIARLTALGKPAYTAMWHDSVNRPGTTRQRIAVLITTSNCIGARNPKFAPALRAALRILADESIRDSSQFRAIGVAMDFNPDSAAMYLHGLADFDQWVVGGNWGNDVVVRRVWQDSVAVPFIPQLLVIERSMGRQTRRNGLVGMYFGPDRVVQRLTNADEIAQWVLKESARLSSAPTSGGNPSLSRPALPNGSCCRRARVSRLVERSSSVLMIESWCASMLESLAGFR